MKLDNLHNQSQENFTKESKKLGKIVKGIGIAAVYLAPLIVGYNCMQEDSKVREIFENAGRYRSSVVEAREQIKFNYIEDYKISKLENRN